MQAYLMCFKLNSIQTQRIICMHIWNINFDKLPCLPSLQSILSIMNACQCQLSGNLFGYNLPGAAAPGIEFLLTVLGP